jgi:pyruvate dehydrogenase E1 component alpha subunit
MNETLIEECDQKIMEAYNQAQTELKEEIDEVFDYTYATLTDELAAQKKEAKELLARGLLKHDY